MLKNNKPSVASILMLLTASLIETFSFSSDKSFIMSILYCGIFEVLIGFLLQFKGQKNTSPQLAGNIAVNRMCVCRNIRSYISRRRFRQKNGHRLLSHICIGNFRITEF